MGIMPLIALDQTDLDRFANDGVLLLPWRLSSHHVRTLIEQLPAFTAVTRKMKFSIV